MASKIFRISGVDVKPKKALEIGLQKLHGIGPTRAIEVCAKLGLNPRAKIEDLRHQLPNLTAYVDKNIESRPQAMRREAADIIAKIRIQSFQGQRHQFALPLRGQKSPSARTQQILGVQRARLLNFPLWKPKAATQRYANPKKK